ncbi:hypothetical protein ACA910_006356 [Epithemia clementina (nom. ined.)]
MEVSRWNEGSPPVVKNNNDGNENSDDKKLKTTLLLRNRQRQRKREIRRRVREYEKAFHNSNNSNFTLLEMENDLMRACGQTRNDPHEVVLLVYTMARISMMTSSSSSTTTTTRATNPGENNNSNNKFAIVNHPLDFFPAFDPNKNQFNSKTKKDSTSGAASSLPFVVSLPERFGYLLWNPRNGEDDSADDDDTPLQWALEAAAKKVVQFIVAWHILWLGTQIVNNNDKLEFLKKSHYKQSVLEWLDCLIAAASNTEQQQQPQQGSCCKINQASIVATRDSLSHYRSLTQTKFSMLGLVSFFISPYLVGYPILEQYVAQAMNEFGRRSSSSSNNNNNVTPIEGNDDKKDAIPAAAPISNCSTMSCRVGGGVDEEDESYSFCTTNTSDEEDDNDDGDAFSLVGTNEDEIHEENNNHNGKHVVVTGDLTWEVVSVESCSKLSL